MRASLEALLASSIDYAGTFPPEKLDLAAAMRRYAGHLAGPRAGLLGRFVVAAAKLGEFEGMVRETMAGGGPPWPLSVVIPADLSGVDRLGAFAQRAAGRAAIAAVEVAPLEARRIPEAASGLPAGVEVFFEVPLGADPKALEEKLAAIARAKAGAKVRTGGLEPGSTPRAADLARFIAACARAGVPWKATAGLHHPFRGELEADGPESGPVPFHGFVNLAAAAALVHAGKAGAEVAAEVLEERSPDSFRFGEEELAWRGRELDLAQIEDSRRRFFRSFGSCSFDEPLEGLEDVRLLSRRA